MCSTETKALHQLTSNAKLSDDVIYSLQQLILVNLDRDDHRRAPSPIILDPLLMKLDRLPPRLPRSESPPTRVFAAIHHPRPQHWTLLAVDSKTAEIKWYDPLFDSPLRTSDLGVKMTSWAANVLPPDDGQKYQFRIVRGPRQSDNFNCGIFVLRALYYLIERMQLPTKIDPSETRAWLVRLLQRDGVKLKNEPRSPLPLSSVLASSGPLSRKRRLNDERNENATRALPSVETTTRKRSRRTQELRSHSDDDAPTISTNKLALAGLRAHLAAVCPPDLEALEESLTTKRSTLQDLETELETLSTKIERLWQRQGSCLQNVQAFDEVCRKVREMVGRKEGLVADIQALQIELERGLTAMEVDMGIKKLIGSIDCHLEEL